MPAACPELMALGERGDFAATETVDRPVRDRWDRLKEEATLSLESLSVPGNMTSRPV